MKNVVQMENEASKTYPAVNAYKTVGRFIRAYYFYNLTSLFGDVPLTPEQRGDIEKLAVDADARHEGARAAKKELLLAMAAQVQAGTIDRAALQPKIDALVAAAGK